MLMFMLRNVIRNMQAAESGGDTQEVAGCYQSQSHIHSLFFYWIFILLCIHLNPIELMVEKEMMEEERAEINFHVCKLRIAQSLPLDVNLGFNKK